MSTELKLDCADLFAHLKGMASIHARRLDKCGWGSHAGNYSVVQGYIKLLEQPHVLPNPTPWKGIWSDTSIPKIDIFY